MEKFNFRPKKKQEEDEAPANPTRRGFLLGGLAAAATVAVGSPAEARKKDPSTSTPRPAVVPTAPETIEKKVWTVRDTRVLLDDAVQIDRAFLPLSDQGIREWSWILEDFGDEMTTGPEAKSLRERYPNYPEMKDMYRYFSEFKIEFAQAQSEFKAFSVEGRWDEAQKAKDTMSHLLQEIQGLRRYLSLIPGNQDYLIEKKDSEADALKRNGSA